MRVRLVYAERHPETGEAAVEEIECDALCFLPLPEGWEVGRQQGQGGRLLLVNPLVVASVYVNGAVVVKPSVVVP